MAELNQDGSLLVDLSVSGTIFSIRKGVLVNTDWILSELLDSGIPWVLKDEQRYYLKLDPTAFRWVLHFLGSKSLPSTMFHLREKPWCDANSASPVVKEREAIGKYLDWRDTEIRREQLEAIYNLADYLDLTVLLDYIDENECGSVFLRKHVNMEDHRPQGKCTEGCLVDLNVSGTLFRVPEELLHHTDWILSMIVNGGIPWGVRDNQGRFFLDQDATAFRWVLHFLCCNYLPKSLFESQSELETLSSVADFLCLESLAEYIGYENEMVKLDQQRAVCTRIAASHSICVKGAKVACVNEIYWYSRGSGEYRSMGSYNGESSTLAIRKVDEEDTRLWCIVSHGISTDSTQELYRVTLGTNTSSHSRYPPCRGWTNCLENGIPDKSIRLHFCIDHHV